MKPRLLLIEDSIEYAKALTEVLNLDFEVIHHNDGYTALLWLVQGNEVDIILTDLNMPEVNGFEFVRFLHSEKKMPGVPILAITAFDQPVTRMDEIERYFDDFLLKSLPPSTIIKRVKAAFDAAPAGRGARS